MMQTHRNRERQRNYAPASRWERDYDWTRLPVSPGNRLRYDYFVDLSARLRNWRWVLEIGRHRIAISESEGIGI